MPRKISAEVDMQILKLLACDMTHAEIADELGVSTSYVSKVKTGRKRIDVYIPKQLYGPELLEKDLQETLKVINELDLYADPDDFIKDIQTIIRGHIVNIKALLYTLKNYKENK